MLFVELCSDQTLSYHCPGGVFLWKAEASLLGVSPGCTETLLRQISSRLTGSVWEGKYPCSSQQLWQWHSASLASQSFRLSAVFQFIMKSFIAVPHLPGFISCVKPSEQAGLWVVLRVVNCAQSSELCSGQWVVLRAVSCTQHSELYSEQWVVLIVVSCTQDSELCSPEQGAGTWRVVQPCWSWAMAPFKLICRTSESCVPQRAVSADSHQEAPWETLHY